MKTEKTCEKKYHPGCVMLAATAGRMPRFTEMCMQAGVLICREPRRHIKM